MSTLASQIELGSDQVSVDDLVRAILLLSRQRAHERALAAKRSYIAAEDTRLGLADCLAEASAALSGQDSDVLQALRRALEPSRIPGLRALTLSSAEAEEISDLLRHPGRLRPRIELRDLPQG